MIAGAKQMDELVDSRGTPTHAFEAKFQPMGFLLRVTSNSRAAIEAAETSFRVFGPIEGDRPPDLNFQIFEHEIDDNALDEPTYRTAGQYVYQTSGRGSTMVLDLKSGFAYGYFSRRTLSASEFFRWHFLDFSLFFMLEWRGLVGVHGAALSKNGQALLLRAPSGQGKTTLTFAAARRRFQALAEDVVWIDAKNDRWWGTPSRFHLLPDAKRLFPELQGSQPRPMINGESKIAVDLEEIRAGSTATSGRPGNVMLLHRRPGGPSSIEKLGLSEAYQDWLTGCAANESTAPNYERLVTSMLQGRAYRFNLGDDIEAALDLLEPYFD